MDKILYIGELNVDTSTGGDVVNKRNYIALQTLFEANFLYYTLKHINKIVTFINLLLGNVGLIRIRDYRRILKLIKQENVKKVFLGTSKLGKLAKIIKTLYPHVSVITFFHNIEKQYYEEQLKIGNNLQNRLIAKVVATNEISAVTYSDMLITLNRRDSNLLQQIYNRNSNFELPTTFIDCYDEQKAEFYKQNRTGNPFKILFVGNSFFANNYGAQWFIDNILPKIGDVRFTIIGKGMDSAFQSCKNIEIKGFVPELSDYYYSTDVVVEPIFHGGGMKTKTAEALMYGCPIIGTTEAFEGYDIDFNRVGGLANTADEMVEAINRLKNQKIADDCRAYSRSVFLEKYSFDNSVNILKMNLL